MGIYKTNVSGLTARIGRLEDSSLDMGKGGVIVGPLVVIAKDITCIKNGNDSYGSIRAENALGVGTNENGNSAITFNWSPSVTSSGFAVWLDNSDKKFKVDIDGTTYDLFNAKENQGVAVPDSTASDVPGLVADFNTLLASLRGAGLIAT